MDSNLNPIWNKTVGFTSSIIFISIYFITVLAVFEGSHVGTMLTPFFTLLFMSINLCLLCVYLGTLLGGEVTMIKEEVHVPSVFQFCCGERQVNRKMLSPLFEKHRKLCRQHKVIPGLDVGGGIRLNHLHD